MKILEVFDVVLCVVSVPLGIWNAFQGRWVAAAVCLTVTLATAALAVVIYKKQRNRFFK